MTLDTLKSHSRPTVLRLAQRKALTARKIVTQGLYSICRQSDFTWRYMANLRPSLAYQRLRKPLSALHEGLLADLKRDGIIITSVAELLQNSGLFEELESAAWQYEASLADKIVQARLDMDKPGTKTYLFTLFGRQLPLDPESIFVQFALQSEILHLVNGYFGMLTKLQHYNVWHTFPTQEPARESQLWHRDPEDRYVLKMFVYLTDVDEGAGPLTYAPGTHAQGTVKTAVAANWVREGAIEVRRSDDAQMEAVVPRKSWITAIGSKGTIVLADTRGYHKGGLAREHERILYMCMFASQASNYSDVFTRSVPFPHSSDKAMAFATGA